VLDRDHGRARRQP